MRFSHISLARHVTLVIAATCAVALHAQRANAGGPPQFSEFTVVYESLDVWTVYGEVVDEQPGQCDVDFGGLFAGESVTPDADGYFELSVTLEPNSSGIVSGVATDPEGKTSETAEDYIQ